MLNLTADVSVNRHSTLSFLLSALCSLLCAYQLADWRASRVASTVHVCILNCSEYTTQAIALVVLCWLCVQEHLGGPDLLNVTRMFDSMNDLQHAFNNATVEWKERLDAENAREANTTNRTHRRNHLKKLVVDKSFLFPTPNNTPNKSKQTNKSKLRLAGRAQRAAHPSRSEHYKTLPIDAHWRKCSKSRCTPFYVPTKRTIQTLEDSDGALKEWLTQHVLQRANKASTTTRPKPLKASANSTVRNGSLFDLDLYQSPNISDLNDLRKEIEKKRVLLCTGVRASSLIIIILLLHILVYCIEARLCGMRIAYHITSRISHFFISIWQ